MINIVSEPDVPIGFLDYYYHDKSNKTLLPGLQLSRNHSAASQIPPYPVKYFPQLCFPAQRPPFLLYPSFRGLLVFFHRTRFRASGETLALLYRLKEGDCAQGTRTFVREISLRITCDILKPQYGFRQCHDTLKTVLQRNSKNSAS